MKEPKKENKPTPPADKPPQAPSHDQSPPDPENAQENDQDPKAISESLRRIRTSGPLIIEAIKQKQDQDRINEIIAQSVEGASEGKEETKFEIPPPPKPPEFPKTPAQRRPTNPTPPSRQAPQPEARKAVAPAPPRASARPTGPAPIAKPNGQAAQSGIQATAQAIAQTAANTVAAAVAATQSVARKTTGTLSGTAVPRSNAGSLTGSGQLPLNGPSTVLVQASGLQPQPGFGSKFRLGLIALAVLLAAGTYFIFRDRLLTQAYMGYGERNLVSSEDESAQFVRLGQGEREQGNYDAAIYQFQRGVELAPNNPNVRFLLAQTYLNANRPGEALSAYQDLLRIDPEHLEARLQVAEIHRLRGDWAAAYKGYQNIIQLDQNSGQAAVALEAIEKYQAAQREAQQEVAASLRRPNVAKLTAPVLPSANPNRAPMALSSQRPAPGIRPPAVMNNRPEEKPDPRALADAHKKLGVRYLNVREFRAAINEFLMALRMTPEDKDLYYFIGSSYHGLGQPAEAHDYYRRVDSGPYLGPAQSGSKQTE